MSSIFSDFDSDDTQVIFQAVSIGKLIMNKAVLIAKLIMKKAILIDILIMKKVILIGKLIMKKDVFKALIKRICKDKEIDIKLTHNLNQKIKKNWNKVGGRDNKIIKGEYTARQQ